MTCMGLTCSCPSECQACQILGGVAWLTISRGSFNSGSQLAETCLMFPPPSPRSPKTPNRCIPQRQRGHA